MKKSIVIVALAVAFVLAFAATASATSAKTWNYQEDYYSWGSTAGSGIGGVTLGAGGAAAAPLNTNPANPGVHAGYQTTTAKCGICHSVHRATAGGVKLLNATTATCAGCHAAGSGTVTTKLISWQTGGPHGSGTPASCANRTCHATSPHGAGGSVYPLFRSKLLTSGVDAAVADAVDVPGSGITSADLAGTGTLTAGQNSAVRMGYTCASEGCHEQTQLTVLAKGWAEQREQIYPLGNIPGNQELKTGHLSSATATSTHASYVSYDGCTGCHDQTDAGTTSGYTMPHSQTAFGASNTSVRSYLWMTINGGVGSTDATAMSATNMKSFDGACLKCHRDVTGNAGIGITH